mmetsp:Transcript_3646/g.8487  ORF Transcript_3646/g.8487 Transcript_3646/m.8487 type:complete len:232 (-) Transcript_3646:312-1007(-)
MELGLVALQLLGILPHGCGTLSHNLELWAPVHDLRWNVRFGGRLPFRPRRPGLGLVLLLEDPRVGRHCLLDLEGQEGSLLAVVPPCYCDALLLDGFGDRVHPRIVVRSHKLLRALHHVHVLFPHDLQDCGRHHQAYRTPHHHHPDLPDGLGTHRQRHRGRDFFHDRQLPNSGRDSLLCDRHVRELLLSLLAAFLRGQGQQKQQKPKGAGSGDQPQDFGSLARWQRGGCSSS